MTPERWRQIEEVFHAAAERAPDARATFLDQACRGDTELRREVESLLTQEGRKEPFIETMIYNVAESLTTAEKKDIIGQRIGAYRIIDVIGEGGMGTVFRAVRDDDQYKKEVAIKLVKRGMDTDFVLSRFRHERQILAGLEHPYIARLLEGGTTEEGLPYFVLEYVEGQPITRYSAHNKLSLRDRLKLFQSVCEAVAYAHRNLVIHRDIKPGNILVTEEGVPKLLDFGIAKLLEPDLSPDATAQTLTAVRAMTPDYASPEQVRGGQVTTATDVYSLGTLLYELLTGQKPHQFKALSALEIERVICQVEPEKPSEAVKLAGSTFEKLSKQLDGDLDNIILKAMRKEPERRYQSVEQLSEDINRYMEGRAVMASKDTLGYRVGKFVRRHKAGVSFAVALLVLLAGVAITMTIQAARIARERDRANQEAATTEQVSGFLVDMFDFSDPFEGKGKQVTAEELLDRGTKRIKQELSEQPEVQARIMDTLGRVYKNLGEYDKALPLIEQSLALRRQVLGEENAEVANSLENLGGLFYYKGKHEESAQLFREALQMRRRLLGNNHPDVAESLQDMAVVLNEMNKRDEAEPLFREALAMRRRLLGEHGDVATTMNNLAVLLVGKGEYDEAESLLSEALAMRRKLLGDEHPLIANTLNDMGSLFQEKRDFDKAEVLLREALVMRRKLLGDDHPRISQSRGALAAVLYMKRDYEAAEELFRESIAAQRKIKGEKHPQVAILLNNLATVLRTKGDYHEAEPLFRESLSILQGVFKPGHPDIAGLQSNLGQCLIKLGRYAEAEKELLAVQAPLEAASDNQSELAKANLDRLIELYKAWGKSDKASHYTAMLQNQ